MSLKLNNLEMMAMGAKDRTLLLRGRCHPKARVHVSYTEGSGQLVITCAVCGGLICEVEVSE